MGKNYRGRGRGRGRGGGQSNRGANRKPQGALDARDGQADWMNPEQMRNARFEAYYRGQGLLTAQPGETYPDAEGEWGAFWATLKKPLPTTFRITNGRPFTPQVLSALRDELIPSMANVEFEGERVPPPEALAWYPRELGWQFDVRRQVVRKEPHLKALQGWLVHETETGSISRQEAVSMLPPLFLNAQHDHLTLDMCAAPGSKTAQLLEAVHAPLLTPAGAAPEATFQPAPLGIVIANDSDYKRASLLKHQASRFASPNLMVTNCDARFFPDLSVAYASPDDDIPTQQSLRYDRILCDVPCSGDGTVRKNVLIWRDWTFANANGLHKMQLQILLRGLSLLADGGRLVYSTCSLNPIENEAVVAEALRAAKAQGMDVELVDTRAEPEFAPYAPLVRYPGVTSWNVCPLKNIAQLRQAQRKHARDMASAAAAKASAGSDSTQQPQLEEASQTEMLEQADGGDVADAVGRVDTGTDVDADADAEAGTKMPWVENWDALASEFPAEAEKVPKSYWPQGDEAALGIPRCMRVYPHLQNTGGFFVAVLRKGGAHAPMAPGIVRGQALLDEQAAELEQASAIPITTGEKRPASPSPGHAQAKRAKVDSDAAKASEEHVEVPSLEEAAVASESEDRLGPDAGAEHPWRDARQEQRSALGIRGDPSRLKEDAFTYISPTNHDVAGLRATYRFPVSWARNFMVRNSTGEPKRIIYFTTPVVRAIVTGGTTGPYPSEETRHRWPQTVKLRLIYTGNRLFVRQGSDESRSPLEKFRITEDGEALIRPYLAPERVIHGLALKDLAYLIRSSFALVESIPEGPLRDAASSMSIGSYILALSPERGHFVLPPLPPPKKREGETSLPAGEPQGAEAVESAETTASASADVSAPVEVKARLDAPLSVPIWRAPNSIVLMLDKKDKSAMSFRLYGSDLSSATGERFHGQQRKPRAPKKPSAQATTSQEDDEDAVFNAPPVTLPQASGGLAEPTAPAAPGDA